MNIPLHLSRPKAYANKVPSLNPKQSTATYKFQKLFSIPLDHLNFLKYIYIYNTYTLFTSYRESIDDFSLKLLSFLIKNIFQSLSKSYQSYCKELEKFINVNIHGIAKHSHHKTSNAKHKRDKSFLSSSTTPSSSHKEDNDKLSFPALSLFSENTFFEKFLENSNMTQQLQQTLKKLNKTFSSKEFNELNTNQKQEYVRQYLIKPLTETLSLPNDFFCSTNFNNEQLSQIQCQSNLTEYINFDIQSLNLTSNNEIDVNNNQLQPFDPLFDSELLLAGGAKGNDASIKLIDNEAQMMINRNVAYRKDPMIEIDLYQFLEQIEPNDEDSDDTYNKNIKEISKSYHLYKFTNKIQIIDQYNNHPYLSNTSLFDLHNIFPTNKDIDEVMSQYRKSNGNGSQGSSVLNGIGEFVDVNAKITNNNEHVFGFEDKDHEEYDHAVEMKEMCKGKVNVAMEEVPSERIALQEAITKLFSRFANYQEISFKGICTAVGKCINEKDKEREAIIFYNMLIACQNSNISIKQTNYFGDFYYEV